MNAVYPKGEICNGKDDDCDNRTDEDFDKDGDGYTTCLPPIDCNDTNPSIHPGAKEICNGKDDNCNGVIDDDCENRPPVALEIPNLTIQRDSKLTIDLRNYFYDPDNQTLTFSLDMMENISLEIFDSNVTLIPKKGWVGEERTRFYASDGIDEVGSNIVGIKVIEKEKKRIGVMIEDSLRREFAKKDKVRVIVKFRKPVKPVKGRPVRTIEALGLTRDEFEKKRKIKDFEVGVLSRQGLERIRENPNIEGIYIDRPVSLLLDESIPLIRGNLSKYNISLNGSGESICLLDTGVNYNFIPNYAYGYDFVNDDPDPMDDHGHGTSVANVIYRIAPGSKLIVAKVINSTGQGYESDVLAGLEYCIEQNVSIISFSIGSGKYSGYCDSNLVANRSNEAILGGIFVVAATGNDGSSDLRAPSCGSLVTRVAASDKKDEVAYFSNINEITDLLAPGVNINTIGVDGSDVIVSGTSVSSPHVAGAAALILENESLKPNELKYRFRSTGKVVEYAPDPFDPFNLINYSRIDVYNALLNNKTNEPYNYTANQTNETIEEEFIILLDDDVCQDYNLTGDCDDGVWTCDTNSTWCTSYGCNETNNPSACCDTGSGTWLDNDTYTYENGSGDCCGDDTHEYYGYFDADWEADDGLGQNLSKINESDAACCNNLSCVYQGVCNVTGTYMDYDSDGETEYCTGTTIGDWVDVDVDGVNGSGGSTDTYDCAGQGWTWTNLTYAPCENGDAVCDDFDGAVDAGGYYCCGDDANEYYLTCDPDSTNDGPTTCSGDGNNSCCDAQYDCVYNKTCYDSSVGQSYVYAVEIQSDPVTVCFGSTGAGHGVWRDCDYAETTTCQACISAGYAQKWVAGGESSTFGEYDTGTSIECCEDDTGENYRTCEVATGSSMAWVCDSTKEACCDSGTDCISTDNVCKAINSVHSDLNVGGNDTNAYCNSTGWVDCDNSSTYCGTGYCNFNWNAGSGDCTGEVDCTTSCCGDDAGENYITRVCASGVCTSDSTDDACCDVSSDCVYSGTCYANGYVGNPSGDGTNEECSSGTWTDAVPPSCSIQSITEGNNESYQYVSGTILYYSTAVVGNFTVTVSASDTGGSGVDRVNFPNTVSAGGDDYSSPYSWEYDWDTSDTFDSSATVTCYDNAGNLNTATFTVNRDVTPPSGGSVSYTDGYYTTASVSVSFSDGTDSESGVNASSAYLARREATLSGGSCGSFGGWSMIGSYDPLSPYTDDTVVNGKCYQYRYNVSDNVKNEQNYSSANTTKIDTQGPTSSITYPDASSWQTTNFSSNFTYSDSESGLDTCEYKVVSYTTITVDWTPAGSCSGVETNITKNITVGSGENCRDEGLDNCTVYIRANDSAGNLGSEFARNFSIDWTSPSIGAVQVQPTSGSYTAGTFTVNASVSDSGGSGLNTSSCEVCHSSSDPCTNWVTGTYSGGYCYKTGITGYADGTTVYVNVRISDNASNLGTGTQVSKIIDSTGPTSSVESPAAGSWQRTDFDANLSYSDSKSGVDTCQYKVTNSTSITLDWTSAGVCSGNSWSILKSITVGSSGNCNDEGINNCTVYVRGYDELDNLGSEGSRSFSIDWTPPTWSSNETNISGLTQTGDDVYFNITLQDGLSGGGYYIFSFDNGTGSFTNDSAQPWTTPEEIEVVKTITASAGDTVRWKWYFNDSVGNMDVTDEWSHTLNTPPDTTSIKINSTSGTNRTNEDLECYATLEDAQQTSLTAYWRWYKDDVLNLSGSTSVTNGTETLITTLLSGNTTKGETWKCSVLANDGVENETDWNNASLTILNSPPSQVILDYPPDGHVTTNRTIKFNWTAATDPDGDTLNYTWMLDCIYTQGSCTDDDRTIENITTNSYVPTSNLKYFDDDGYYYNWSVKAWDGETYGEESENRTLNVTTLVILNMINDSMDFGAMLPGEEDNTTDDSPSPFSFNNTGNCIADVNISIYNDDWLFDTVAEPSDYFNYSVGYVTGQEGAFNLSGSQSSPANVPLTNVTFIDSLNYTSGNNSAEVDIYILIPSLEPPGNKSSTIFFAGEYSGEIG
jgi:hypothetical protein